VKIKITVDCDDDFLIAGKTNYKGTFQSFDDLLEFMQENVTTKYSRRKAYDMILDCKTHRDKGYEPDENQASKAVLWLSSMLPNGIALLADKVIAREKKPKVWFGGNWETMLEACDD
jgi:hypothetical protein